MRFPALLLSLLAAPALHAADGPVLLGDANCRVVNLHPAQNNRVEWTGPCKDGYAHGKGVLVWEFKKLHVAPIFAARYEGDVERGLAHGTGRKTFWDASVYEGEFRNGRFEGRGVMRDTDGRYEGEWKAGLREGRGKMVFHAGGSYDGGWQSNNYFGDAEVVFPSGRKISARLGEAMPAGMTGGELIRPAYVLRFGDQPARDPAEANKNYGLDFGRPLVGEEVKVEEVRGSNVPYSKSYEQLSPEQKQLVRDAYPLMDNGDEPPYPQHGTQGLMMKVRHEQGVRLARGLAVIYVTVNAQGDATSALVARTPKQTLTDDIKAILLKEKYKPGTCSGAPCEMVYPYFMNFDVDWR